MFDLKKPRHISTLPKAENRGVATFRPVKDLTVAER
jgi:hypothetical protein